MVRRARPASASGNSSRSQHRNLSDEVYTRLRRDIVHGVLRPNEALVEADLADRLRVSRTPIRESMQRLALDGLIVSRRRRWFVYEHTRDEVVELYEVRAALEGCAARLAAERATDEELEALRSYHDATRTSVVEGPDPLGHNERFHDMVIAAADNARLTSTINRNRMFHFNRRVAVLYTEQDLVTFAGHHTDLVAALTARDGTRAEAVAREHVEQALALILRKLF